MATEVKKLQFSEGTDVGAPTDLSLLTSTTTITAYANDAAYVSANGTATEGDVYLNTTTKKFRMYLGASWRNAVPESDPTDPTKLFLVDVTGNTTGMSVTLSFAATSSRNIQFPDTDMTVAGRANAETLSAKTLASPLISGGSVDVSAPGNLAIGASIGANNLTLGGATTTVKIPGALEIEGGATKINTTDLEVEDAFIVINKGGTDGSSEGAGIEVDRTGTSGSIKYEDALASKFKIGALGAEKEIITTDTVQSLENKRLKLQTTVAANDTTSPRLVLPSNTYANLATISGANHLAEGAVYWATDTNKAYIWDGSALVEVGSGSGSGTGAKNYLQEWFDAEPLLGTIDTLTDTGDRTTGTDRWGKTSTGALAEDTTTELRGTQSYKFTPTGSAEFIETPMFTLETMDLGKPVYVSLDLNNAGVDGDFDIVAVRYNSSGTYQEKISVAGNASSGTPASAKLPLSILKFSGFFLPTSTAGDQYSLRIRRLTSGTTAVIFDSISAGPQAQFVGQAISDWKDYTVTSASMNHNGTMNSSSKIRWCQVGTNMLIDFAFHFTSAGSGSGLINIPLPTGYTIDQSKYPNVGIDPVAGGGYVYDSTAFPNNAVANFAYVYGTNTSLRLYTKSTSDIGSLGSTAGSAFTGSSSGISGFISVPIVGWSSNVVMADRAVEEYVYNTSSATASDDTTSFGYGIGGQQFVDITATITKRCRFQTPIQATDRILLEYTTDGGITWGEVGLLNTDTVQAFTRQGTVFYGMHWLQISNTDIDIQFGAYRKVSTTASYAAAGTGWSAISGSATYKWRLKKVSAGGLVGYPVGSRNIIGDTTGTAVPTGYLGEKIEASLSNVGLTSSVSANAGSIALTPGNWMVYYKGAFSWSAISTVGAIQCSISTTSATDHAPSLVRDLSGDATAYHYIGTSIRYLNVTSSQTIYAIINATFSGATTPISQASGSQFFAIRMP